MLGGVSAEDLAAGVNLDPLSTLQGMSPAASSLVKSFSVFAISTSFLGFVLGLVDFLSDGFGWREEGDARPYAATLIPPTIFAVSNPDVFLSALDTAGAFGVLTLFGCLPRRWRGPTGTARVWGTRARREGRRCAGCWTRWCPAGGSASGFFSEPRRRLSRARLSRRWATRYEVAGSIGGA